MRQTFPKIGWDEARRVWLDAATCKPGDETKTAVEVKKSVVEKAEATVTSKDAGSQAALEELRQLPVDREKTVKLTCAELNQLLTKVGATVHNGQLDKPRVEAIKQIAGEHLGLANPEILKKLNAPINVEKWADKKENGEYKKPESKKVDEMRELANKDKDSKQMLDRAKSLAAVHGIDAAQLETSLLELAANDTSILKSNFKSAAEKMGGEKGALKILEGRFPADKKNEFDTFLKARGISKEKTDLLVRYVAFNDVEKDIKNFDEYLKTPEGKAALENVAKTPVKEAATKTVTAKEPKLEDIAEAYKKGGIAAVASVLIEFLSALWGKLSGQIGDWFGKQDEKTKKLVRKHASWLSDIAEGEKEEPKKDDKPAEVKKTPADIVKENLQKDTLGFTSEEIEKLGTIKMQDLQNFKPDQAKEDKWNGIGVKKIVDLHKYLFGEPRGLLGLGGTIGRKIELKKDDGGKNVLDVLAGHQAKLFPQKVEKPAEPATAETPAAAAPKA